MELSLDWSPQAARKVEKILGNYLNKRQPEIQKVRINRLLQFFYLIKQVQ